MSSRRRYSIILVLIYWIFACGGPQSKQTISAKGLAKNQPQPLQYENVSVLLEDMNAFSAGVRARDQKGLQKIEELYRGVSLVTNQAPLLYNVYPDPAGGRIVFVVFPKNPRTGSNYLLTFDKNLPVVNTSTVEVQIRTKDPEQPLNCLMQVPDAKAYMDEYRDHKFEAEFTFSKKFLQSGTFDFDALTMPTYRTHGHPFIVFDLIKMILTDTTAELSTECRQ